MGLPRTRYQVQGGKTRSAKTSLRDWCPGSQFLNVKFEQIREIWAKSLQFKYTLVVSGPGTVGSNYDKIFRSKISLDCFFEQTNHLCSILYSSIEIFVLSPDRLVLRIFLLSSDRLVLKLYCFLIFYGLTGRHKMKI